MVSAAKLENDLDRLAQKFTGSTVTAYGTATTPGAAAALASIAAGSLVTGATYELTVWAWFGSTGDVPGNVAVYLFGLPLAGYVPMQGGNNTLPVPYTVTFIHDGTNAATVGTINAGAAGSKYYATMVARRVG